MFGRRVIRPYGNDAPGCSLRPMKVDGKVLIVTGGGNGIGREVTLEALRRGASVAALDIRQESLDETVALAAAIPGASDRLATFVVDITDRAAVDAVPAQAIDTLGQLDGVVNVAGIIQPFIPVADLDLDTMHKVVDVNLWGTIHVIKAALPHLLERPEAHIANVSSMGGFLPVPGQSLYGASKAAVKLLTEALWTELLETDVGVTAIMPGGVSTDITGNSGVVMEGQEERAADSKLPITTPADAAETILDGIEDDKLHVYVGKDAKIMGLLVRLAPKQAAKLIQRQMKSILG